MDVNLPFEKYYPPDDHLFTDPLFVPYQRKNIPLDDQGCYIPVNSWSDMGNPNFVNEAHYRREWNLDFKRLYGDPCPGGWRSAGNGMCVKVREEGNQSNFYTDDLFKVKYQYHNGYTVDTRNIPCDKRPPLRNQADSPTFKGASLNPKTGNYVLYYDPIPNKNENRYGGLPSRDSYLAH